MDIRDFNVVNMDKIRKPIKIEPAAIGGFIAAAVLLFLSFWYISNSSNMDIGHVGMVYSAGPLDSNKYIKTLAPGSSRKVVARHPFDWWNKVYSYPVTQRDYIISSNPNEGDVSGVDEISFPSKDRVNTTYNVALYFDINTDENIKGFSGGMLQKFHERIGVKYEAWTPEGWNAMLRAKFRKPLESALQQETSKYTSDEIYGDKKFQIEKDISAVIDDRIVDLLGDKYFKNFKLKITKAEPPESVKDAYNKTRSAQIGVQEQKQLTEQAKEQAKQAITLREAIKGDPNYAVIKAIESGKVQFMVIPQGSPVSIPVK
jgi:regulator of protease activity HflC (stomatin/prohibitin superfamily)